MASSAVADGKRRYIIARSSCSNSSGSIIINLGQDTETKKRSELYQLSGEYTVALVSLPNSIKGRLLYYFSNL